MSLKYLFCITLLCLSALLPAQQWQWLSRINYGYVSNNHSALAPNGKLYIAIGTAMHEVSTSGATLAVGNYSGSGLLVQALKINSKGNLVVGGYAFGSFTLAGQQWSNTGGGNDIFIAELTPQYQQVWSHVIGGQSHEKLNDLGIDKNDSIYFTGQGSGTFNFMGKQLNGRLGSSYVAKLNPAGNLAWVYADSSDNSLSEGKRISVNENGESLTSIDSKNGSYFYLHNAQFFPASSGPYYYGDYFALLVKSNGSLIKARSDQKPKWSEFSFAGLSSSYWYRLEDVRFGGDSYSEVQEYDFTGDTTGGYSGSVLDPDDNYTQLIGIVDNKAYFLCSYSYFDQTGKHFEHNISIFEQHQMKNLIQFSGTVYDCHLQKRNDNTFILDGIFSGRLKLGSLSMTTPSVGVSFSDTVYANHTFIAAFNLDGGTGITELSQTEVRAYPNPSKEKLCVTGCELGASVFAYNAIGQKIRCSVSENKIDVTELSAGVYFIELKSGQKMTGIKFIRE
jgi:hypothetical protein